ncbi:hypothetical protein [Paenibacillus glycinis]|uniref:Uncharacterized protein n=1 Tax=Paenibacillus glycinis TaxID=2697035 RepID=A0ABW9XVN2_9BACL|nr:hypothetical protein [Paenibacillus glycinis]NBD26732.1 hypothetical protein [Paenibacillus glycinis]
MKRIVQTSIMALTAAGLLFQPIPLMKVASAATVSNTLSSKVVSLGTGKSLVIRDAKLLMQGKGLLLAYTVTITNNSTQSLDLLDYWIKVKSSNGKTYKSTVTDEDKDIKYVEAKSSINLTYYTTVDSNTKLTDLSFNIVKWDFSVANYERSLATIQYNGNSIGKTPLYKPSVMLFSNTKIKGAVKQYYITQDQSGIYLTINYLLENVGSSSAALSQLGFALQTDSNSVFDIAANTADLTSLQPKERKIISLHAKLPNTLTGKKLALIPFTKDDTNKIEIPNGSFEVPALKPQSATEANKSRVVYLGGKQIQTLAKNAILNENDGSTDIALDFTLNNIDVSALTMPGLEFSIQTPDNISYPLTFAKSDNTVLLPKIEQDINLSGTIPKSLQSKALKLVVKSAATDAQESYLLGIYNVQTESQEGSVGGSFTYNNDYSVQLSSIQRTPSGDDDILLAELSITNKSNSSKSVPSDLTGYFLINGVKVDAQSTAVGLDQTINIAPNGTYHTVVFSKIPYTTTVDKISFVLTQSQKDANAKKLYQYSSQAVSSIPQISNQSIYAINNVGSKSNVKLINANVYTNEENNYLYTEFEMTNMEARAALMSDLSGYLEDDAGVIVPVTFTPVKDKLTSNGKALISAWGQFTKSFNLNNYRLIIGNGVKVKTDTTTDEVITVNPVSYLMKNETPVIKNDFNAIKFSAYALSMRNIQATFSVSGTTVDGVKMNMDYDLVLDPAYDYVAGDHKLLFEFVDQGYGKTTYTKEFAINQSSTEEPPTGGQSASVASLKYGTSIPLEFVFSDSDILSNIQLMKNYKLNVYDEVAGAKVLLATKELTWFERQ